MWVLFLTLESHCWIHFPKCIIVRIKEAASATMVPHRGIGDSSSPISLKSISQPFPNILGSPGPVVLHTRGGLWYLELLRQK